MYAETRSPRLWSWIRPATAGKRRSIPVVALFLNVLVPAVLALTILFGAFMRPRMAVTLFLYAILFCPYIRICGLEFRLEHIVAPLLFGVILVRRPTVLPRVLLCLPILAYLAWLGWCLVVTLFWSPAALASPQSWVALQGVIRPVLIMAMCAAVAFDAAELKGLFKGFAICAIPLACLGIAQTLNIAGARWLTEQAYVSSGRAVFVAELETEAQGYMLRGISVFENASYAGTFYILALLAGALLLAGRIRLVSRWEKLVLILALGFVALGGIFTMSATFTAGVLVIGLILFARTSMRAKWRMALSVLGILLLLVLAVDWFPPESVAYLKAVFAYQSERLSSGELFKGRFMDENGMALLPSWRMALDNPLFGLGLLPPAGVIVNDSLYITLLFSGGAIGLALFALIFLRPVFIRNRDLGRQLTFGWLILMFAVGFGCSSFFNLRMGEWVWALVAVAASRPRGGNPARVDATSGQRTVPAELPVAICGARRVPAEGAP